MDYKVQHHIQQDPDHINIHWDSLTICQYNCSYCYARNEYGERWGKLMSKDDIDIVIDAFSRSSLSFNLGLLGGEPTLHPHFEYILENVSQLNNNQKIYVTTNGLKDISQYKIYKNVAYLFSYHPDDIINEEAFLGNIRYCKENGIQVKVNVMLHHNKLLWSKTKAIIERLQEMDVKVHPHFLYVHSDRKLFKYRKDFWEYFSFLRDIPPEYKYDDDTFNDFQVFEKGLTNFKGWNCWNNNYEVDVYGNVVQFCKDPLSGTSLLKDRDYFKRITSTKAFRCPHSACNCDGLLKQYKENDRV